MAEVKRDIVKVDNLNMTLMGNKILCKVELVTGYDKIKEMWTGNAEWSADGGICTRFGEVVKLPNRLTFIKYGGEKGMEWRTELETKTGDIACWGIMEGTNCPMVLFDGGVYFLVDYGEVRLLKRGEEIIPVNGFILLEECVEELNSSLITPDSAKKTNKRKGIVKYIGKRNECYYPETKLCDPININVGDKVLFRKPVLTNLEDSRYRVLDQDLFYVQGRWVITKF